MKTIITIVLVLVVIALAVVIASWSSKSEVIDNNPTEPMTDTTTTYEEIEVKG